MLTITVGDRFDVGADVDTNVDVDGDGDVDADVERCRWCR